MKTWNNVFSSAVFRLIVIVLAVVILLNLLTLILGSTVISEVEHQISLETQNALQLYMSQIDDALARINIKMYMLSRGDADFSRLNEKEILDTEEYYRQMQSVVSLGNTLSDVLEDNTLIDGVFAYFPGKDYYIGQGGITRYSNAVKVYIMELASSFGGESRLNWQLVKTMDDEPFLLLLTH